MQIQFFVQSHSFVHDILSFSRVEKKNLTIFWLEEYRYKNNKIKIAKEISAPQMSYVATMPVASRKKFMMKLVHRRQLIKASTFVSHE